MSRERFRPSLSAARQNWRRSDLPFLTKLRMATANNWRKMRTRRNCCGHPGEPGC